MRKRISALWAAAPFVLSGIGCIYALCGGRPWIIVPDDPSFHFNLITVNALFGGFLYTNYSLLVGLLDHAIMEKVRNTQIIRKRNGHILKGIIYAAISVIAGLYLVLVPDRASWCLAVIYRLMQNAEITFMAFLILYFLLSLREMHLLIQMVHHPSGARREAEIEELKDQIRNSL